MQLNSTDTAFFLFVSITLIIAGLLSFFAQDFMWGITEWSNSAKGLNSERTYEWETSRIISGSIALLAGLGLLFFTLTPAPQSRKQTFATEIPLEPTTAAIVARLNNEISPHIFELFETKPEGGREQRISGSMIGVSLGSIRYGWCADTYFYAFINDFPSGSYQNYLYLANTVGASCTHLLQNTRLLNNPWFIIEQPNPNQ
jgi:hypothetical protein